MAMRSTLLALAVASVTLAVASEATEASAIRTFKFTAADLLDHQFANGADGTTAADNDLYAGARSLQYHESPDHEQAATTFEQARHALFSDRWDTYTAAGYMLDEFTLWGLGGEGRASAWGEDFKPLEWLSVTTPEGWSVEMLTAPSTWSELPAGHHTLAYPRFVGGPEAGFALDADLATLAAQRFSVTIAFDTDDAWWDGDTQGDGLLDAPNDLEQHLTMWFGGYVTRYDESDGIVDYHRYEGNFTSIAPSPAAAGAGLVGMLMMLAMRRPTRRTLLMAHAAQA